MKFTFKEHENVCVFNRNYVLKKNNRNFILSSNRLLLVVSFFSPSSGCLAGLKGEK